MNAEMYIDDEFGCIGCTDCAFTGEDSLGRQCSTCHGEGKVWSWDGINPARPQEAIPELPKNREELRELRKKSYKIIKRIRVNKFQSGNISIEVNLEECPFCGHWFEREHRSGSFNSGVEPDCSRCNFPGNIYDALREIMHQEIHGKETDKK